MIKLSIWFGLILLTTTGCAIAPSTSLTCPFVRRELAVSDPQMLQGAGISDPGALTEEPGVVEAPAGTMAAEIQQSLDMRAERGFARGRDSMLFLSGGSLNGAFGAGFLDEWRRQRGTLPEYAVVTGISTGAILSTFAFVDRPQDAVAGYTINEEGQLLHPYSRSGGVKIGLGTGVTLLRKGAIADLEPLRVRLRNAFSDEILTAVKQGADRNRKLYVGAVDVDRGEAVAFDMTDLAGKWFAAAGAERARLKECYIAAIIASSSAPIAAPPVFIDDRMYIDGGVRFGVFSDELGKVLDDRALANAAAFGEPGPRTYVIINGDQLIDDKSTDASPHPDWSFLDLALRSEKILTNQVYRFSADKIATRAQLDSIGFFFAKMNDPGDFVGDIDGDGGQAAQKCSAWKAIDAEAKPVQFYPLYMRCLIAYGRAEAAKKLPEWDPGP